MKRTISRSLLYSIDDEYRKLANENFGIYLLLESKIQQFRAKNAIQLKAMHSRFNDIRSKYAKKDSEGNFITVKNSDGTVTLDFIDGYVDVENAATLTKEEVIQRFDKECESLFSQNVTIEY